MSGTVDEGDDADARAKGEKTEPPEADREDTGSTAIDGTDPAERRCGISLGEKSED